MELNSQRPLCCALSLSWPVSRESMGDYGTASMEVEAVIEKLRASLKRRGADGIRGLGRHFKVQTSTVWKECLTCHCSPFTTARLTRARERFLCSPSRRLRRSSIVTARGLWTLTSLLTAAASTSSASAHRSNVWSCAPSTAT